MQSKITQTTRESRNRASQSVMSMKTFDEAKFSSNEQLQISGFITDHLECKFKVVLKCFDGDIELQNLVFEDDDER